MLTAIEKRRSIRKYKETPVSRELLEEILRAGMLAPSSKNRQPWKFVVTTGAAKRDGLAAMKKGLEREKVSPLLPESGCHLAGAYHTLEIMGQAPVIVWIVNPLGLDIHKVLDPEERIYEICNAQSVGAAIENMTLSAEELGLGSLWICDIYFAYEELQQWLGEEGELIAALAIGYGDEEPDKRPRKAVETVIAWRDGD